MIISPKFSGFLTLQQAKHKSHSVSFQSKLESKDSNEIDEINRCKQCIHYHQYCGGPPTGFCKYYEPIS